MSRQAKISITGDSRGFRKQVDEAKKALENLGKSQVTGSPTKTLSQEIVDLEKKIKSLNETKALLGKGGIKGSELESWKKLNKEIRENKRLLQEARATREALSSKKDPRDKLPENDSGGETPAKAGRGIGGWKSALTTLAGGYGIMSMWQRRSAMADQRMNVRGLTTDGGIGGEVSALGFSPEERRARQFEIAKNASPMRGRDLTSLTDMGEQLERGYGISGNESASAIGAARRAGIQDQGKFLMNTVSTARGVGLEGPQIGEYLSSMTGFLSEISKGVNIDSDSLQGFAGALGQLPFFKTDPTRIFDVMRGMNQAFTGGDEFQKAQAVRAISKAAPGASASELELRREDGIFGGLDPIKDAETIKGLKKGGVNTSALEVSGGTIMKNLFDDVEQSTKGMSGGDQVYELKKRLGLKTSREAEEIFAAKQNGMSFDKIADKVREFQKSPEEKMNDRLGQVMNNADGMMEKMNAAIDRMIDGMAVNIAEPMAQLGNKIMELIKALGFNPESTGSGVGTAAIVGATALGGYGLLKGMGGTAGKGGLGAGLKGVGTGIAGAINGMGSAAGISSVGGIAASLGSGLALGASGYGGYKLGESIMGTDFGKKYLTADFDWAGMSDEEAFKAAEKLPNKRKSSSSFESSNTKDDGTVVTFENTNATVMNTMMLKELSDTIKMQKAGGGPSGSRFPSNANMAGRRTATGK